MVRGKHVGVRRVHRSLTPSPALPPPRRRMIRRRRADRITARMARNLGRRARHTLAGARRRRADAAAIPRGRRVNLRRRKTYSRWRRSSMGALRAIDEHVRRACRAVALTPSHQRTHLLRSDDTNYPDVGDVVTVHYTITLADDESAVVEDSRRREPGFPFTFKLGSNRCIPGWDWALTRMSQGQRCVFTVPPDYAYGAHGQPPLIPANAALTCDVELVSVGPVRARCACNRAPLLLAALLSLSIPCCLRARLSARPPDVPIPLLPRGRSPAASVPRLRTRRAATATAPRSVFVPHEYFARGG